MLAPLLQLPPKPGPLGPASALPSPVPAQFAKPEAWRVERIATPAQDSNEVKVRSLTVTVAGRRVVLKPKGGYDYVDGVERGRDGSLLVHRVDRRAYRWEWRDDVWYRGKEKRVWGAQVYLDRMNYAGYFIRETNALEIPETAPEATAVREGRSVSLGWGWPQAWTPDGTIVLQVPVDGSGQPAGNEFSESFVTRLLSPAGEWRVSEYGLLGRARDGTIVLALKTTSPKVGSGSMQLGGENGGGERLLYWRDGRFVAHVALPERWHAVSLAPEGWVLARKTPVVKPQSGPSLEGKKVEEIVATLERRARSDDDPDTQRERDWTVGVVRDGTLTPVLFSKPKGTERLLWRGGARALGKDAFRFSTFWGDEDRWFRVSRPGARHKR